MEQIKPLREMSPREKIRYIWDYYKVPIFGVLAAVLAAGLIIRHYVSYRSPAMALLMVNVSQTDDSIPEDTFSGFLDANGFHSEKDTVSINATLTLDPDSDADYNSLATFQAWVIGESYSGFFSDEAMFAHYAPYGYFRDLSGLLSGEELDVLSDRLLYADAGDGTEPYPCAIRLDSGNCPWLAEYGYTDCYFGILYGKTSDALASALIRYIVFSES